MRQFAQIPHYETKTMRLIQVAKCPTNQRLKIYHRLYYH